MSVASTVQYSTVQYSTCIAMAISNELVISKKGNKRIGIVEAKQEQFDTGTCPAMLCYAMLCLGWKLWLNPSQELDEVFGIVVTNEVSNSFIIWNGYCEWKRSIRR